MKAYAKMRRLPAEFLTGITLANYKQTKILHIESNFA
jgi:hypothetical protein